MLDTTLVLLALAAILLLVCLLEPLAQRLAISNTLILAALGMVLGLVIFIWGEDPADPLLGDLVGGIRQIGLSAEAFLVLFLPPLLFTAGLGVDLRLLKNEVAAVLLLAVVAVVICTAVVGLALMPITTVGLVVCLVLGAVVAPTDPAAVIGIFRDIGAPRRLSTLVSGESLFNDAAAIVLFGIFTAQLADTSMAFSLPDAALTFLISFLGGVALGLVLGKITAILFGYLRTSGIAATTISVAMAYLAFILGEEYLQVSGVVAVVTTSLIVSLEGPTRLTASAWNSLGHSWQQLDFWANSLIFVLASMLAVQVLPGVTWADLGLLAVLVLATLVARALVLYLLLPLLTRARLAQPVGGPFKAVILWGGLRGAVTLVLALSFAADASAPPEVRHFVAVLATTYVLFTLFVQAPTLKPLLRLLGLDQLPPVERMLRDRVMALSRETVRRQVSETAAVYGFSPALAERLLPSTLPAQTAPADLGAAGGQALPLEVGLLALVAQEKELYRRYFSEQTLSRRLMAQLNAAAEQLLDAVHDRGLAGYNEATSGVLRFSRMQRLALWLQRRLGWSRPLALTLADRFETLIITQIVVRRLLAYAQTQLKDVMGEEVSAELQTALQQRLDRVNDALAAVDTRYPSYAEALRTQYLARAALRLEGSAYEEHLEQSLISREVFADLQRDLKARWDVVNRRPTLDLGLDLAGMVARVPLFRDLPRARLAPIAAQLRPDLAVPGEHIIVKGSRGNCMFFLVSGEVVVRLPQGDIALGAGSFFGEMALLSKAPRNADVVARGFCHLLVLEAKDFRRVVKGDPELKAKIEAVAAERRA